MKNPQLRNAAQGAPPPLSLAAEVRVYYPDGQEVSVRNAHHQVQNHQTGTILLVEEAGSDQTLHIFNLDKIQRVMIIPSRLSAANPAVS